MRFAKVTAAAASSSVPPFPWLRELIGAVTSCAGLPAVTSPPPPSNSALSPNRHFPLETTPDPVDLGILSRGQSAVAKITLRNPSRQPAIVERIQTELSLPARGETVDHVGAGGVG